MHHYSETRNLSSRLTLVGVFLVACQCGALVLIAAAMAVPHSLLGSFLSTSKGLAIVALGLSGGLSIVAPLLAALGIPVARRRIDQY